MQTKQTTIGIGKDLSRTAVFYSAQNPLGLVDCEIPSLKEGEILIRNEYTTLCRSDLNTYAGKRREKCPTILGHEIVGRIVAFGPQAPQKDLRGHPLQVGDRVTWSIFASRPDSPLARMGIPQKGQGLFKYGHEQLTRESRLHGGLSQYCILRRHTAVIRIDEAIPLPVAATINCAGATIAGALRLAGPLRDKTVAVSGAGMLGVIACAMSHVAGARRIIAMDTDEQRLLTARSFGARETCRVHDPSGCRLHALAHGGDPIHIVFELSGVAEAMESTLRLLGIGGTALWVGATYPQRELRIDAEYVVRRLLTVKGLHNYNGQDLQAAVAFFEAHHAAFPFTELICDRFTLEQAQAAFDYALASPIHRVGIRMGEAS